MNKQEAIDKLKDVEAEMAKLKAIIEAPVSYKRPRAEAYSTYYYIDRKSRILNATETGHSIDQFFYDSGNYFLTEEEAKKKLARDQAYLRMTDAIREANEGWVPDFNDRLQDKWYMLLYKGGMRWDYCYLYLPQPPEMCFSPSAKEKLGDSLFEDFKIWVGVE